MENCVQVYKKQSVCHRTRTIVLVVLVSFLLSDGWALDLYSTPDYRTSSGVPACLVTSSNCAYVLAYTLLQPLWSISGGTVAFPLVLNGSTGISIAFSAINSGFYGLRIEIDRTYRSEAYLDAYFYNSSSSTSKSDPNFISTLTIGKEWLNAGSNNVYVWGDNLLKITSMQIVMIEPVTVDLVHSPYYAMLFLVTNVTTLSVSNKSLILSGTTATLQYKTPITYQCNNSILTPTNPADFANYTFGDYSADLANLALSYTYAVANDNSTMLSIGNISSTTSNAYLVLAVSNVLVDCTVDVTARIGGGLVLGSIGTFSTVFQPVINQSVTYVETISNISVNISHQLFTRTSLVVTRLYYYNFSYQLADGIGFNSYPYSFFVIDGSNTTFTYLNRYQTQVQFSYLKLDQTPLNMSSVASFNMPDRYLRNQLDQSLHSFTLINGNLMYYQVVRQIVDTVANLTYYQKQMILQVVYNISINPNWVTNLNVNRTEITVNNVPIPQLNKYLVNNTNNLVEVHIQFSLPLPTNSNVTISFNSNWCQLQDFDGTCQQWTFPAGNVAYNSAPTLFPSTVQPGLIKQITSFVVKPFEITSFSKQSFQLFTFSYFINNFIAFQNLAFLYFFIPIKNRVNVYSRQISDSLFSISESSSYLTLINNYFGNTVDLRLLENKIQMNDTIETYSTSSSGLSYYDYGFHSDYVVNNSQNLSSLLLTCLKLLLLKLLSYIPIKVINKAIISLLRLWKQFILTEIVIMAPNVFIVLGIYAKSKDGFSQTGIYQILNIVLIYVTGFVCLLSVFGLMSSLVRTPQQLAYRRNKTQNRFDLKYSLLLNNSLYILIPFLSTSLSPLFFIPILTSFSLYVLYKVIASRKLYSCGSFTKQLLKKIMWICFNLVYFVSFIVELVAKLSGQTIETNYVMHFVAMVCDMMSSFIFLGGCLLELAIILISIIVTLVMIIKNIFKSNGVAQQNKQNFNKICSKTNTDTLKINSNKKGHPSHQISKIEPEVYSDEDSVKPNPIISRKNLVKMRILYKQKKKNQKYIERPKCNSLSTLNNKRKIITPLSKLNQ